MTCRERHALHPRVGCKLVGTRKPISGASFSPRPSQFGPASALFFIIIVCAGNYLYVARCDSVLSRGCLPCLLISDALQLPQRRARHSSQGRLGQWLVHRCSQPFDGRVLRSQGFENARTGVGADTSSLSNDIKRSYHSFRAWMTSGGGRGDEEKADTLPSSRLVLTSAASEAPDHVVVSKSQSSHHDAHPHEAVGITSLEGQGAPDAAPDLAMVPPLSVPGTRTEGRRRVSFDAGARTSQLRRAGASVGSFRRASVPVGPMHQASAVSEAHSADERRRRGRSSVEGTYNVHMRGRPRRSIASTERRQSIPAGGVLPQWSDQSGAGLGADHRYRRTQESMGSRSTGLHADSHRLRTSIASNEGRQLERARRARDSLESLSEVFGATAGPMLVNHRPPRRSIASPGAIAAAVQETMPERRRSSATYAADDERGLSNFVGHISRDSSSEGGDNPSAAAVVVLLETPSAAAAVQVRMRAFTFDRSLPEQLHLCRIAVHPRVHSRACRVRC